MKVKLSVYLFLLAALCLGVCECSSSGLCFIGSSADVFPDIATACSEVSCSGSIFVTGPSVYGGTSSGVISSDCTITFSTTINIDGIGSLLVSSDLDVTIVGGVFVGGVTTTTNALIQGLSGSHVEVIGTEFRYLTGLTVVRLTGSGEFDDTLFVGCTTSDSGATYGAAITATSNVTIRNSQFTDNVVATGAGTGNGAVFIESSGDAIVVVEGSSFSGDVEQGDGSPQATALRVRKTGGVDNDVVISQCNFTAGVNVTQFAVVLVDGAILAVEDSNFDGQVRIYNSDAVVSDCALNSGDASSALFLSQADAVVARSTLVGSDEYVGAFLFSNVLLNRTYMAGATDFVLGFVLYCNGGGPVQTYKAHFCNAPELHSGCTFTDLSPLPVVTPFQTTCDAVCAAGGPCVLPSLPDGVDMGECLSCGDTSSTVSSPSTTTTTTTTTTAAATTTSMPSTTPTTTTTPTTSASASSSVTATTTSPLTTDTPLTISPPPPPSSPTTTTNEEDSLTGTGGGGSGSGSSKEGAFPLPAIIGVAVVGCCVIGGLFVLAFVALRPKASKDEECSAPVTESEMASLGPTATPIHVATPDPVKHNPNKRPAPLPNASRSSVAHEYAPDDDAASMQGTVLSLSNTVCADNEATLGGPNSRPTSLLAFPGAQPSSDPNAGVLRVGGGRGGRRRGGDEGAQTLKPKPQKPAPRKPQRPNSAQPLLYNQYVGEGDATVASVVNGHDNNTKRSNDSAEETRFAGSRPNSAQPLQYNNTNDIVGYNDATVASVVNGPYDNNGGNVAYGGETRFAAREAPKTTMRAVRLAKAGEDATQAPVTPTPSLRNDGPMLIAVDEAITEMKMDDPLVKRVKFLGSGTFGDVSLYKWNYMNVAVKVVKNVTPDTVQDFIEEAQTLAQLRCPHCVSYAGICLEPLAIVTEYMPGGDLYDFLKEPPSVCTIEKRCEIVADIAAGLAFLHSQGIAHRDLKPANILLTKYYEAKLADFGLSGDKEASLDGAGTPMYAAPEVFRGETGTLASDIYSFGVIVIEVLGQVRPFNNESMRRAQNLSMPPCDFDTLVLPHSDELLPLVQAMVETDPARRPQIAGILSVFDRVFEQ